MFIENLQGAHHMFFTGTMADTLLPITAGHTSASIPWYELHRPTGDDTVPGGEALV